MINGHRLVAVEEHIVTDEFLSTAHTLRSPAVDRDLGFEFGDPASGGDQFGILRAGRAGQLTGADQVLAAPDVDRLITDVQIGGDLSDPAATACYPGTSGREGRRW